MPLINSVFCVNISKGDGAKTKLLAVAQHKRCVTNHLMIASNECMDRLIGIYSLVRWLCANTFTYRVRVLLRHVIMRLIGND